MKNLPKKFNEVKTVVLLIQFYFFTCATNAQGYTPGFDVKMRGYIFTTESGLFFQPLDLNTDIDFLKSLNKSSFLIEESNLCLFRQVIKGVGHKLIVNRFTEDSIAKNPSLDNYDTVYYFKSDISITVILDKEYLDVTEVGFGFFLHHSLIYFGHLRMRSCLLEVIPIENNILKQLRSSYKRIGWFIPTWLENEFAKRKIWP